MTGMFLSYYNVEILAVIVDIIIILNFNSNAIYNVSPLRVTLVGFYTLYCLLRHKILLLIL